MDFGQMIESLFFYQQTTVHINRASIQLLLNLAATDVLEELLKYHGLRILYNNSYPTVGIPGDGTYWVDTIGLSDLDVEKELYEESLRSTGDETKSRKFAKKIARQIGIYELPFAVKEILIDQLQDPAFLKAALDETLKVHYPTNTVVPADRRYELEFLASKRFKVHTNLNDNQAIPFHDTSPVLSLINAAVDLQLMAENKSEICLPEFNAKLVRSKVDGVLDKSNHSAQNISRFTMAQFNEAWAIREAINSKDLHVKAILPALRKADRFKGWLNELPDNHDLMYDYLNKVEEKTVLDHIGFKNMKFYFFTTLKTIISAASPVAGLIINPALSVFDTFLVNKMMESWKPSQFVRGDYKKLLKK